jgi:phage terminase large subunit GpA-like protein
VSVGEVIVPPGEAEPFEHLRWLRYENYLTTAHWRLVRRRVFERFDWKCGQCGSSGPLHAHHLTYERRGRELRSDLVALCRECHQRWHRTRVRKAPRPTKLFEGMDDLAWTEADRDDDRDLFDPAWWWHVEVEAEWEDNVR